MTNPTIDGVFELLDARRHLPKYQLELRASPFFELFLLDVLNAHYKPLVFREIIIPEFPLKKANNQSDNADFFALSEDGKCALLIELKTDMGSLRDDQSKYLKKASETELKSLVDEIISISTSKNTKQRKKYVHLLKRLSELELVNVDQDVYEKARPEIPSGLRTAIVSGVKNKDTVPGLKPKVVYILPSCNPANKREEKLLKEVKEFAEIICFEEFAKVAEKRGPLGKRFAKSLRRWAEVDAGSHLPDGNCP